MEPEPLPLGKDDVLSCESGVLHEVSAYVDADKDGRGGPPDGGVRRLYVCEGDSLPRGFALESEDCNDADPKLFQQVCVDRDGDGVNTLDCTGATLAAGQTVCGPSWQWMPSSGALDCDDDDAQRTHLYYRDLDADGRGAGEAVCSGPQQGWSLYNDDCADNDASRVPYAYDVWGDGADPDCDGSDGGSCASLDAFQAFDGPKALGATCEGPRFALGVLDCSRCQQQNATLVVENRDLARVQAELEIVSTEEPSNMKPYRLVFSVDLAPGERKAVVSGPFIGSYEVRSLTHAVPDCFPADNVAVVSYGHCI